VAKERKKMMKHSAAVLMAMIGLLMPAASAGLFLPARSGIEHPVGIRGFHRFGPASYPGVEGCAGNHLRRRNAPPVLAGSSGGWVASVSSGSRSRRCRRNPVARHRNGQKKSDTGILLVPGFPAPSDVLPVDQKENGRAHAERSEAGGRVFSRSYRISFAAFTVDEAKALGLDQGGRPGQGRADHGRGDR